MNIRSLIDKLSKFKLEKLKIDRKDISLKRNDKIMDEGDFISSKISNYINKELKYKYTLSYRYKDNKIKVRYFRKSELKNINKLLEIVINRIIFMMKITDTYKDVNMFIYDTPFKKKLPCKSFEKCKKNLSVDDINTGYSWSNNIVIYRKEELLKLIIHEMIHLLDIDVKYEGNSNMKNKFLKSLCIESFNVLINESYVETWAIIIHMYIGLLEQKRNNYLNYEKYFKKTLLFNYNQVLKILIFYNINNFEDILNGNGSCKRIIDFKMNLFSYHILKLLNLIIINKFIKRYSEKKLKNIIKKEYNFDEYIEYLSNNIGKMSKIINKKLLKYKKEKYNLSLKMSLN